MEEQILAYLEKKLPTETRQAFETALINDAVLQKEFQIQRELWEKLRLLRLRNKVKDIIAETDAKKGAMEAEMERKRQEWEEANTEMTEIIDKDYYKLGASGFDEERNMLNSSQEEDFFGLNPSEADFSGKKQFNTPTNNSRPNRSLLQYIYIGVAVILWLAILILILLSLK
jgi:hypothetical protein